MKVRKLSTEELMEVLNERIAELGPEQMMQMFNEATNDLIKCNGPGFEKKFPAEEITAALLLEVYKKGFANALVLYNEAIGDIMQKGNAKNGKNFKRNSKNSDGTFRTGVSRC